MILEELIIALCIYAADMDRFTPCVVDPPTAEFAEGINVRERPVVGCDRVAHERALAVLEVYRAEHPDKTVVLKGTTCRVLP